MAIVEEAQDTHNRRINFGESGEYPVGRCVIPYYRTLRQRNWA